MPVVNQVEVHPFFANEDVRAANARHGVLTEAWSPIAQGKVHDDDTIGEIAALVGGRRPRSRCAGTCSAATSSSRSR